MTNVVDRAVADAQGRSNAARARLLGTVSALRRRLTPRSLLSSGIESVSRQTVQLLDSAQSSARRNPLTTGGGIIAFVVAVGLRLWLARRKSPAADETGKRIDR